MNMPFLVLSVVSIFLLVLPAAIRGVFVRVLHQWFPRPDKGMHYARFFDDYLLSINGSADAKCTLWMVRQRGSGYGIQTDQAQGFALFRMGRVDDRMWYLRREIGE